LIDENDKYVHNYTIKIFSRLRNMITLKRHVALLVNSKKAHNSKNRRRIRKSISEIKI